MAKYYCPKQNHLLSIYLLTIIISFTRTNLAFSYKFSATITSLPGFSGPLPFKLETGYIGVGENEEVELFYYFVESERNPSVDPVMLWLTGGPGCSAFSGLVYEIGPLKFKVGEYKGSLPNLVLNPYSWTKVASIIFLDSPVGTGFSYSRSFEGWSTGDIKSTDQAYQFLTKWLINHPKFLSNPIYIGGDSYSGLIVPRLVQDISNGNGAGYEPFVNLKGYHLGNPLTDQSYDRNSQIPFSYGMGLISEELYQSLQESCGGEYANISPTNIQCQLNLMSYHKCILGINNAHILEPTCFLASPNPKQSVLPYRRSLVENLEHSVNRKVQLQLSQDPPVPPSECRSYGYVLSYLWTNDKNVRKALHVREGTIETWTRCNYSIPYKNEIQSSLKYHSTLSERGYRSLIYSGDHDLTITFIGTQGWIKSLNYSIIDDWRPWYVDDQIAGYTRKYSNRMTFATLKGAGHTGAEYKPKEGFWMFKRWISNESL